MAIKVIKDGKEFKLVGVHACGPGGRLQRMFDLTRQDVLDLAAQAFDGDPAGALRAERDEAIATAVHLEAHVAIARQLLEADYRRRQVGEHENCTCRECSLLRHLFSEDGGRAFVEEYREMRMACESVMQELGPMLARGALDDEAARDTVLRCAKAIGAHVTFSR